jgi:hypothetical protein
MRRDMIESLESRQLLSATFPNAIGNFVGPVTFAGGTTTLDLDIVKQKGGNLSGGGAVAANAGRIHGSINKKDVIHLSASGKDGSGTFVGKLSGDTLIGVLKFHSGKTKINATVTLSRATD